MIFYGNGIVWNKEKNCMLCKFEKYELRKGRLETMDEELIKKLKKMGYKYELTEKDLEIAKKESKKK